MTERNAAYIVNRLVAPEHRGTEADIQATVRDLLLRGGLDLQDDQVRLESPAFNRQRIDVEVGSSVIEVKRDLTRSVDAAKEQLAGYLHGRQAEHGSPYVGILTDGIRWRAYRLPASDNLVEVSTLQVSQTDPDADQLLLWLDGIMATQQQISPTPMEVALRLGASSSATQLDLSELTWIYEECSQDPAVQLHRELWARLLTTAFGTSFNADDTRLFLEHTYLVVLAKLVAHAAVQFDLSTDLEPDELLSGRGFADRGILGVVESDFFDWPASTLAGRAWVSNLARRVARFRWAEVEHDVLKVLYESVIGRDTRHALGEYYTPDWLAKSIVEEVVDDPLRHSVLDPGCGSGTFVFWSVKRCLEACESAGMTTGEAISNVTGRVFGIDIHPVAVALARVTYLLAIGTPRLNEQRPKFAVPVWLGDSVQYQRRDTLHDAESLTIYVDDGATMFAQELRFPDRVINEIRWFDSLVTEMTERAARRAPKSPVPNLDGVYNRHGVQPDDRAILDATMRTLCDLCDEGRNHIWGYFVRNEARPRWLSRPENRVDRLVGNPPWLSYRYMTAGMQKRFRELSTERSLWHGAKVATHQDLSALFVVRSVEQYLRTDGRFGFLMPLAVLTRQAYVGFRSGGWGRDASTIASNVTAVDFDPPWDLHDIVPRIFPVPAAAVLGKRTDAFAGRMHGKAVRWSGTQPKTLDPSDCLTTEDVPLVQMPTTDSEWSPYKDRFYQGATLVPRSLVLVEPRETGALGSAFGMRSVQGQRSVLEKKPWKALPTLVGTVEDRFIFGVHLGPTIYPFRTLDPQQAVLPWTGERLLAFDDPDLDRWPGLAKWLSDANERWFEHRAKSAQSVDLSGWFNYHGKLVSQAETLGDLRVVYTKSGQYLAASLVDDPRAFIDHKLYWCRVSGPDEGRYLTAVLNAPALNERIAPLQARGEHNPRDIDKYVWALPIPRFRADAELHQRLVGLAVQAEEVAAGVDMASARFEHVRRNVREALVQSGIAGRLNEAVDSLLLESSTPH
jgi:SAM-dependent methyltransferase